MQSILFKAVLKGGVRTH